MGDLTGDSDQRFAAHLKEGELESQPEINFDAWRFLHARKIYERRCRRMRNNSERPVDALAEKHHWLTDNLKSRDASASKKESVVYWRSWWRWFGIWMIWLKIYSIALWAWRRKSSLHAIIVGKCKNKWRRKWRNDRWFRRLSEQLKFGLRKPLEMNMDSVDNIDFVSYNMTWLHVGGHEWYSFIECVILWLIK